MFPSHDSRSEVEEAISKVKGKIVIKEYAPKRASLDTIELSEGYVGKRYDAVFSGVDVDKLNDHRSEVEEAVSKVKGKIVIKGYATVPSRRYRFALYQFLGWKILTR